MPDFIFPSQHIRLDQLKDADGKPFKIDASCDVLEPNTPYCVNSNQYSQGIHSTLSGLMPDENANLMCSMDIFDQQLLKIADLYDRAIAALDFQATCSLVGAGTTASHARLTGFQKALVEYQKALIALSEYGQSKKTGRPAAAKKSQLKAAVQKAYQHLQTTYQAELKKMVGPKAWGKNRGSALSSAQRGINVATHRKYRHLHIENGKQAMQLSRLAKGINYAGNGMIILDAGIRVNRVHSSYNNGEDWHKELSMQTTGFGTGAAIGILAGRASTTLLTTGLTAIGLTLGPVGWLVIIGTSVAAGYYAGKYADKLAQGAAGKIYDKSRVRRR